MGGRLRIKSTDSSELSRCLSPVATIEKKRKRDGSCEYEKDVVLCRFKEWAMDVCVQMWSNSLRM